MSLAARRRGTLYWASVLAIFVSVVAVAGVFLRLWRLPFFQVDILGVRNSPQHWSGWVGALYIGILTPVYMAVKRLAPARTPGFLKAHTLGNLVSAGFVSVHFAHQLTRPASSFPEVGTGVVLVATVFLLALSGFATYYGYLSSYSKQLRWLHPALALTFFMVVLIHIWHGMAV